MSALRKMAKVVDCQGAADPRYVPIAPKFSGIAFQAPLILFSKGRIQPSGYTEPILHHHRLELKDTG